MGSVNEDFDAIDEQEIEIHGGHSVDLVVSVRLDAEESRLLAELAAAEGADPAATLRAALHHYAAAAAQRTPR
jgi:Ribbon-helix-helix protein, copG family